MKIFLVVLSVKDDEMRQAALASMSERFRSGPDVKTFFLSSPQRGRELKVAYAHAIRENFDVVMVADARARGGLGFLDALVAPFANGEPVDGALAVPVRVPLVDRFFAAVQNCLAGVTLKTWNPVAHAFSIKALQSTGYSLNTNRRHFETEVLLQLIGAKAALVEVPVASRPRCVCRRWNGLKAALKFKLQKWHLFFDVRYHPEIIFGKEPEHVETIYEHKNDSKSPHTILFESDRMVPKGARVLDVGCASGYVAEELHKRKGCAVTGVDVLPKSAVSAPHMRYEKLDLESQIPELVGVAEKGDFDVILMLDVLEHMAMPEKLLLQLSSAPYRHAPRFVCSTANIAFVVVRLMLLMGHFNYGQKGILDITHKRLFSLHTFRNLLEQTGFVVRREHYFPFPFRQLGFRGGLAKVLEAINVGLIKLRPRLFSYQIMLEASPLPHASKLPLATDAP